MSRNIILSPKYGVNPTIPVCFWCGEQKPEIALMGRVYEKDSRTGKKLRGSDVEMPMSGVCLDIEPCPKCEEIFRQGVLLMECVETPNGKFSVTDNKGRPHWLTGRYAVKKADEVMCAGSRCLIDTEVMEHILSQSS